MQIAEYASHNSLVVTPEKLNQFYATYKLESEAFPFQRKYSLTLDNTSSNTG